MLNPSQRQADDLYHATLTHKISSTAYTEAVNNADNLHLPS